MRLALRLFSLLVLTVLIGAGFGVRMAAAQTVSVENNVQYYGSDYRNFAPSVADPEQCRAACAGEGQCVGFTYDRPYAGVPNGMCWLKTSLQRRSNSACCVSGMKSAGLVSGGGAGVSLDNGVQYMGGDYRSFAPAVGDPQQCRAACANEGQCVGFTWDRPYAGWPNGVCWLKSTLQNRRDSACCVSGMKGGAVGPAPPPQPSGNFAVDNLGGGQIRLRWQGLQNRSAGWVSVVPRGTPDNTYRGANMNWARAPSASGDTTLGTFAPGAYEARYYEVDDGSFRVVSRYSFNL